MRILRSELATASAEVSKNLSVAARQRRKQGFVALLETLLALQEAAQLHAAFVYALLMMQYRQLRLQLMPAPVIL